MRAGRLADALTPAVGAVAFILAWWLIAWVQLVDPVLLPSPQDSAKALWTGLFGGTLGKDLFVTVRRTLSAFVIAAVVACRSG